MLPGSINCWTLSTQPPFRLKVPNVSQSFPKQHGQVHYNNIHSWAPTSVLPWFLLPWFKHYPKPTWEEWTYFSLHVTVCQWPKAAIRGIDLFYFILAHHSHSWGEPGEMIKARTWRQGLKQSPWMNTAYWIAHMAFSACFLIHPRNVSPGVAQSTMG